MAIRAASCLALFVSALGLIGWGILTTWLLSGAGFAGYVIPVGVVVATASVWLLLKAVKRV
ncbi:hypothetical protein [Bifidobacterium olomucense]|uniref:hypothetical protein n=1 Tax=Bifidobacterium olomucense TaxID=2675324 RepID=UPI001F0E695E|nr:hypothetical protein [Bifidobacterium sp. DSM 109959]